MHDLPRVERALMRNGPEPISSSQGSPIYLDYHATTPCDPRVAEVVKDSLMRGFGNPSSPHEVGRSAQKRVDQARGKVASCIGALPGEITFTSGATESNNLAIVGLARGSEDAGAGPRRIVTSSIEHKSVAKPASSAAEESEKLEHRALPVTEDGVIDLAKSRELIDDRTLLVSVQAVNNEIGTIQPITELAEIAHRCGALLHCDAAQALGRIEIDVQEWDVDFLSLSAHKAYGPKGVGLLYASGGHAKHPLRPLMNGGGQENGVRPGTLNVPAIEGFGEACAIISREREQETKRLRTLRDEFEERILSRVPEVEVVAGSGPRVATTTNLRFPGIEAEALLARLQNVAISTGSACESGAPEPSHVLEAVGLNRREAYQCIRVAVGRFSESTEIQVVADRISEAVHDIRSLN